jgi:hypothetical protein
VQRRKDRPGLVAIGAGVVDGKPAWEIGLAEPLVAVLPADAGQSAILVEASGRISKVTSELLQDSTGPPPAPGLRIAGVVAAGGGSHALVPAGNAAELLILDADSLAPRSLALPGLLAGMPIAWQDGLAVACTSGAIAWLDPKSGQFKADPFQLPLAPGQRLASCSLSAAGKNQDELLVDDGRGKLVRLALVTDPAPHLAAMAGADSSSAQSVAASWRDAFPRGPLAGEPAADGTNLLVATRSGWLCRVAADNGQEIASLDLGQALAGTPLVAGQFALVPTADGTLLKVSLAALKEQPAQEAAP